MIPVSRNRPEEVLQKAVAQYLDIALPEDAVWWHTPNQRGTRSRFENALLKALGVRAGFPDIAVLWGGTLHLIELKSKTGSLTPAQKALIPRLRTAGALVKVCRTPEQVETILSLWGVPLKARLRIAA